MWLLDAAHASEVENTTTEASSEGVLHSLGIDTSWIISQGISFIMIACIIWFLILKPVTKKMSERQKTIDDSLKNADEIEKRLTKSQLDYQARIDQAKMEGNKMIEQATQEALEVKESMKQEAAKEIEDLVDQAKKKIQREKEQVMQGIKTEAAELISHALEKIIAKKLDTTDDQKLIQEMIEKIK
jgi:F-type H+-transporting ATPase subunit b